MTIPLVEVSSSVMVMSSEVLNNSSTVILNTPYIPYCCLNMIIKSLQQTAMMQQILVAIYNIAPSISLNQLHFSVVI